MLYDGKEQIKSECPGPSLKYILRTTLQLIELDLPSDEAFHAKKERAIMYFFITGVVPKHKLTNYKHKTLHNIETCQKQIKHENKLITNYNIKTNLNVKQ